MTGRMRGVVLLAVLSLLVPACGGDDSGSGADTVADRTVDQSDDSSASDSDGSASEPDGGDDQPSSGAPDLDPGAMPAPGQVVLEVDGRTVTFDGADMESFICDVEETFVNVRATSPTESVTVQYDPPSGRGNVTLIKEESGDRYDSFVAPEGPGGVAFEAPHVLYESRFDLSNVDDLSDITDIGIGRVSVTCP